MPTLPQLRISQAMWDRLDAAAHARGCGRPELIRWMLASALGLIESDPDAIDTPGPVELPNGSADLPETLVLLSGRARQGVVAAQVALLRHLTTHANGHAPPPSDPLAEVDELAARRLRELAEQPEGDGDAA